jgi:hypothetical protein
MGIEPLPCLHPGVNLAQNIKDVPAEHNLAHQPFAFTADNASNNDIMRQHLESSFSSQEILWNTNMISIQCIGHVLNLTVKAFLKALDVDFTANKAYCGSESESEETHVTLLILSTVSTTVIQVSVRVKTLKLFLYSS